MSVRRAPRADFSSIAPGQRSMNGSVTWLMRATHFVVAYSEAVSDSFVRDNAHEYMVYVPEGAARIVWNDQQVQAGPRSLTIVPPGRSCVHTIGASRLVRVFAVGTTDLMESAANATDYATETLELPAFQAWPMPVDGWRLRHYRLDDYASRRMRLFRSSNLMVAVHEQQGPRDTTALSPHSHADFEQGSLALAGEWVHHLRYPWTRNLKEWREDEHLQMGSPSLLVIPATAIHTSRCTGPGYAQLLDIFAPPRLDFSQQGLVCNADEYPMIEVPA